MKRKISDIWSDAMIWWEATVAYAGMMIFVISVIGAAIIYKTNLNFDSNPIFILSIIGVVAGLALLIFGSSFEVKNVGF